MNDTLKSNRDTHFPDNLQKLNIFFFPKNEEEFIYKYFPANRASDQYKRNKSPNSHKIAIDRS